MRLDFLIFLELGFYLRGESHAAGSRLDQCYCLHTICYDELTINPDILRSYKPSLSDDTANLNENFQYFFLGFFLGQHGL